MHELSMSNSKKESFSAVKTYFRITYISNNVFYYNAN